MKETLITEIMHGMLPFLDNSQMAQLQATIVRCLAGKDVVACHITAVQSEMATNDELVTMFIAAKKVEGCSEKTLRYYQTTFVKTLESFDKRLTHIITEDLRKYLSDYQEEHNCSKANIDNIRRILSSFFAWLEEENFILKSPMRRIHKIKTAKVVKETYTDEALEQM